MDKKLYVGGVWYKIDPPDGTDITAVVGQIKEALEAKTVVVVPVIHEHGNQMNLYVNGAEIDVLVIDLGLGPKPGELSP